MDPRTDAVLLKAGSEISDSTDQPCPSCGGDLENHYQCQSCARLVSEAELTEQYVLAHTPLEEEPEEEMPAFDLESLVDSGESVEEEPEEEQAEDDGEAENLEEVEEDAGVELGMTAIYRVPSTLLLEESRCSECQGPLEIGRASCRERV